MKLLVSMQNKFRILGFKDDMTTKLTDDVIMILISCSWYCTRILIFKKKMVTFSLFFFLILAIVSYFMIKF